MKREGGGWREREVMEREGGDVERGRGWREGKVMEGKVMER